MGLFRFGYIQSLVGAACYEVMAAQHGNNYRVVIDA
jgi:hypothetical protein